MWKKVRLIGEGSVGDAFVGKGAAVFSGSIAERGAGILFLLRSSLLIRPGMCWDQSRSVLLLPSGVDAVRLAKSAFNLLLQI